ncbi:MAG TPA: NAD-dependent epimerase, partial [Candidatus Nocardiopsis merdipullorum]|nr:NAD-dependent epimerase [Candidatus Nocardiopsis merdipullorum]
TRADMVDLIGAVIGRDLLFEEITPEEARRKMLTFAPETIVDALHNRLADAVADPMRPTTVVEEVLGRPARSFSEWVRENSAVFTPAH